MHTLKVTLKQHTPLIHFQHDQEGATLRASEVKPKLDKFVLSNLTPEQRVQGETDGWIKSKNNKVWLDYKMMFVAEEKVDDVKLLVRRNKKGKYETFIDFDDIRQTGNKFPFIIADMGGKETDNELQNMCMHNCITMTIRSSHDSLMETLDNNIECFFATHNFGQRETKGFGSYTVTTVQIDEGEGREVDWRTRKREYFDVGTWVMTFSLSREENVFKRQIILFSVIDFYWRCLKSGINYTRRMVRGNDSVMVKFPERYLKAYLWTYLNLPPQNKVPDGSFTWEKRTLKRVFHLETPFPSRDYADNPNTAVFARGMMGCPVNYEYKVPTGELNDRGREVTESHTIGVENDTIERIASPIVFKPVVEGETVSVYILFDKALIHAINTIPENERNFTFICEGERVTIPLRPECIDYPDLIKKFNTFLFSNRQYQNSLWGYYDRNKVWHSGVSVQKDSEGKVISRMYGQTNISWKFVPRNFQWDNILCPSDNENRHYVSFSVFK